MKFKRLPAVVLLSIGLIACNKNIDYSGNYYSADGSDFYFSFKKITNDEYEFTEYINGKNHGSETVVVKDNSVLSSFDKSFQGKVEDNKFIYKGDERSVFIKK